MAINQWVNLTVDPAAASKPDQVDLVHVAVPGTADARDFTICWDSAVVTSLKTFDSAVAWARKLAISRGLT